MEKMLETTFECRINDLPDSLLLHIFSLLNMKEVVRTSILSKRWQYIWTSVPILRFEYQEGCVEKIGKFVAWVNRTLLLCSNTAIKRFLVDFNYHDCFASDVDVWVRFAAERKVGDLNLHLRGSSYTLRGSSYTLRGSSYTLRQSVCCNSSLIRLSIYKCNVPSKGSLSWKALKNLTIAFVKLNDETISKILSGSPSLEYLNIHACKGINHLVINSKCPREMVLYCCYDEPLLEISAPNLQYLRIWGRLRRQIRLMSISSLLEAEVDSSLDIKDDADEYDERCSYFIELLESLHKLDLGHQSIQAVLLLEAKGLLSPLSRLTCLKLNANIDEEDVPGIVSLLKCSPKLETLVVNRMRDGSGPLSSSNFSKQVENYWMSKTRFEKFPLPHLRTVKFFGFKKLGDVDEFTHTLVQVLLENAELIRRIVISVGKYQMSIMHHDSWPLYG